MSLILREGWVWALENYVTKFYVTNGEGRVGLNPNKCPYKPVGAPYLISRKPAKMLIFNNFFTTISK